MQFVLSSPGFSFFLCLPEEFLSIRSSSLKCHWLVLLLLLFFSLFEETTLTLEFDLVLLNALPRGNMLQLDGSSWKKGNRERERGMAKAHWFLLWSSFFYTNGGGGDEGRKKVRIYWPRSLLLHHASFSTPIRQKRRNTGWPHEKPLLISSTVQSTHVVLSFVPPRHFGFMSVINDDISFFFLFSWFIHMEKEKSLSHFSCRV